MYNITIVGTIHSEKGRCNRAELYRILEDINPEVIFDELPIRYSSMFYSESFDTYYANSLLLNRPRPVIPLEVECIKKYTQNYNVHIVPVDIDLTQKLSGYEQEFYFMMNTFLKYDDYKKLDAEKDDLIQREGFNFLNSDRFLDFSARKSVLEKKIIESEIQKDRLLEIYRIFHSEQIDNRENAMLENIYNYSKESKYNQAVFVIGAEHRISIIQKISQYNEFSEIKLNWKMYESI